MQHLEVSCAVRRFSKSLGFKGLTKLMADNIHLYEWTSVHYENEPRTPLN